MAKPGGEADGVDRKALDELGARIDRARDQLSGPRKTKPNKYKNLSLAWRMVFELVLGVLVGALIGHGFDWLLGSSPLMMVIFGGFGFAAGFKAMLASAREMSEDEPR